MDSLESAVIFGSSNCLILPILKQFNTSQEGKNLELLTSKVIAFEREQYFINGI